MKIKRSQLKQIIKEEVKRVLIEQGRRPPTDWERAMNSQWGSSPADLPTDPQLNNDLQLWWDEVYRAEDRGEQGIPGPGGPSEGGIPNPVNHPEEWAQHRAQLSREAGLDPEGPAHFADERPSSGPGSAEWAREHAGTRPQRYLPGEYPEEIFGWEDQ